MEPDFSGYATKNGLKCSDGRTIMKDAFADQDKLTVPLVWAHDHDDPENVLGHAVLENREDGVYTYGYFNSTTKGVASKKIVQHKDVTWLSIYANNLVEKSKQVFHGAIREVSLVIAGANPGARIDYIALDHGEFGDQPGDESAIIYTGIPIDIIQHADTSTDTQDSTDTEDDGPTFKDVYETLNNDQKELFEFLIAKALEDGAPAAQHSEGKDESAVPPVDAGIHAGTPVPDEESDAEETGEESGEDSVDEETDDDDESGTNDEDSLNHKEGTNMSRRVFDNNDDDTNVTERQHLTHAQIKTIVDDAARLGSLKESFLAHQQEYGIEDIDILFPDAKAVANSPEVIGRRQEWVNDVITGTKHSPFSRIKSTAVDLTADEARAKGYVKGNLKKEEIIKLLKRVTTPTTIYKKQKLDRDDIVDITDLNVVAWLKAEMRVMLDEELARAVLIGDGREADDEDAIDVDHIRPIAYDADMYAHQIVVGSELSASDTIKQVLRARSNYKGTGTPTMYTSDAILTDLILLEDKMGRRLYETEQSLAAALRVAKIVTVEVLDDAPEVVAVIVNLTDYTLGADQGGSVSMFDDFDIDYNQYKYLIETRVSGALTKPKSALVIKRTLGTVVTPTAPSYNGTTHVITFPSIPGVVYSVDGVTKTGTMTISEPTDVEARPSTGYSFPPNTNRDWTYVA